MVGRYKVITLCGSTRFKDAFIEAQKKLTLEGNIVISVGLFGHSGDNEVWENMDEGTLTKTKEMLDDMHKRKIDMADEIFVINVGGYIGSSTRSEIDYAISKGKSVRYLEDNNAPKTWLLSWNEDRWAWDDYFDGFKVLKSIISQVGHAFYAWSCGRNKSIQPGDRIFLIKLGSEPRGIVASGYAVSGVYESPHWDDERRRNGQMARRIQIDFDRIQDYTCDSIITYDSLQNTSGDYHWSIQASGVKVPKDIARKLEALWRELN